MRLSTFRRAAVMTLAFGALGTSACFGSFNLTRKVYGFNKSVSDDKFVQELVFLGMMIVPVYGIAGFVDAVVANTVEFWSGENPIKMSSTIKLDNSTNVQRLVMEKDGVRIMTLKTFKLEKLVATTTVQHTIGTRYVAFETVLANGTTESHVAVMGLDGKAFVSSGTFADLQRNAFMAGF